MWQYLFWALAATWLFSIRSERVKSQAAPGICSGSVIRGPIDKVVRFNDAAEHSVTTEPHSDVRRMLSVAASKSIPVLNLKPTPKAQKPRTKDIPPHMTVMPKPQVKTASNVEALDDHGSDLVPKAYACKHCSAVVFGFRPIRQHYQDVHPDSRETSLRSTLCPYCHLRPPNAEHLVNHIAAKHPEVKLNSKTMAFAGLQQCSHCNKVMNATNLKVHQMQKHGVRVPLKLAAVVCEVCDFTLTRGSDMDSHKAWHHPRALSCHWCGIGFEDTKTAMVHYYNVHRARDVRPDDIEAYLYGLEQAWASSGESPMSSCWACDERYQSWEDLVKHYKETSAHGAWGRPQSRTQLSTIDRVAGREAAAATSSSPIVWSLPSFDLVG